MDHSQIVGHKQLENVFGMWPSFHDAEVISITLDRHQENPDLRPSLIAKVHVFQMTSEVDSKNHYVTKNHSVVTFLFGKILELSLTEFNDQNSIFDLSLQDISKQQIENINYEVGFDGSNGVQCGFKCKSIEVLSVVPGIPKDSIYLEK